MARLSRKHVALLKNESEMILISVVTEVTTLIVTWLVVIVEMRTAMTQAAVSCDIYTLLAQKKQK
jgi:hypothetical protein